MPHSTSSWYVGLLIHMYRCMYGLLSCVPRALFVCTSICQSMCSPALPLCVMQSLERVTRGEEYAIFDALEAKNTSAVLDLIHDKKGINAVDAVRLSGVDRDVEWGRYWERKGGWQRATDTWSI